VIDFEILGTVAAREGDWKAHLQPRQQLMLAALVIAEGAPVPGSVLEHALGWDEMKEPPARGPKGVASELRRKLALAPSPVEPQAGGNGTYRLPLQPEQADVLRFRAGVKNARRSSGPERARLMREALAEWPDAADLYGGNPLNGLCESWAEGIRWQLQQEYRNAVLECIEQDMKEGQSYEEVMRECTQLAANPQALVEDKFVEYWMLATYWSGHKTGAVEIFRRAADFMRRSGGHELSGRLRQLAGLIRDEDLRLGGPDGLRDWAAMAIPEALSIPAAASIPAPGVPRLAANEIGNERTVMSEPSINISIAGTARVGNAIGRNDGSITIHMGDATDPFGDLGDDGEPGSADR
jgi:DNA-binding SARP family transcriptional activator